MGEGSARQRGAGAALGAAVGASAFVVRVAAREVPARLTALIVSAAVLAVLPALQVLVVSWLVRSAAGSAAGFLPPLVALALVVGLSQLVATVERMTGQRARARLSAAFEGALLRSIAAMPPQRLAESGTTALVQACRSSLFDLGNLLSGVVAVAGSLVTAVTLAAAVWAMSPAAGVLVVAALVPGVVVSTWSARMQEREFVPFGEAERRAGYGVEQLVAQRSATELATLGSGGVIAAITATRRARALAIMDRILVMLMRASTVGGGATAVLLGAALVAIVVGGAGGAGIAAGIVGVISGVEATRVAGFGYGDIVSTTPKVGAFRRLVASAPSAVPEPVVPVADRLEVRGLSVTYPGASRPALSGLDVTVRRGEIVALVGVNGAGKTTAVGAILGIVDASAGSVRLDGVDLATLPPTARLARFGMLTQEFGRYELTVRDTVRIGRPDGVASDAELWRALDAARAADLVRAMPDGLDTQLGPQFGGVGLSGGQWQRLALARIHLRAAGVWILDEPTSAIDAEAEQEVFAELTRTRAERITIVVSHRAWTLRGMDRILVLDGGEVVQDGTYETLMADAGGRFARIFAEQAG